MIPLARPLLGEREEELVLETLRSGRLALGPRLAEFESAFGAALGVEHVSAVSCGTAGLHLAIRAAGIEAGDEVVTSPFCFVASANCLLYENARPVFCDIDPRTLNISPQAAADAVTDRTTGLLPVHIFGYPADMPASSGSPPTARSGSWRTPARRWARCTPTAPRSARAGTSRVRLLPEQAAHDRRGRRGGVAGGRS